MTLAESPSQTVYLVLVCLTWRTDTCFLNELTDVAPSVRGSGTWEVPVDANATLSHRGVKGKRG